MPGLARFRALALLVCVLSSRPILTYGGGLLHAPRVGGVPAHELVMSADDGDDDDDSFEDVFSGDPLVNVRVAALPAPERRIALTPSPRCAAPLQRADVADHPPRLA